MFSKRVFEATTFVFMVGLVVSSIYLFRYYKEANKVDGAIKAQVDSAVSRAEKEKAAEIKALYAKKMADKAANPWKTYISKDEFGPIILKYPKDWGDRITEDSRAEDEFVFLADPDWIVENKETAGPFTALVVKVVDQKYDRKLSYYQNKNRFGKTKYVIEDFKLSGILGSKLTAVNEESGKNIVFIMIPYRDKTFYIGTEDSDKFGSTLNIILKKLKLNK